MLEREFTDQVLEFAQHNGWRTIHIRPARKVADEEGKERWETPIQGDGKGFPDLLMARDNRLVVAELKCGKNKKTPEQIAWLQAFILVGAEVFTWYPHEWDEIVQTLERQ